MDTPDDRIAELRRAAVSEPRNGEIRYILGAELAQQRRYDEAVLELSAAIALNPLLHTARLQLGLLHLTLAQTQHASAVLAPLEDLGDDSALKHFKRGLDALAVSDLQSSYDSLKHGIGLNTDNAPLNADMQQLMARIAATIEANAAAAKGTTDDKPRDVRTDFSLYGMTQH